MHDKSTWRSSIWPTSRWSQRFDKYIGTWWESQKIMTIAFVYSSLYYIALRKCANMSWFVITKRPEWQKTRKERKETNNRLSMIEAYCAFPRTVARRQMSVGYWSPMYPEGLSRVQACGMKSWGSTIIIWLAGVIVWKRDREREVISKLRLWLLRQLCVKDMQHKGLSPSCTRRMAHMAALAGNYPDFLSLCFAIGASHTRHL